MLSGRGLCDELITRPEESYRLCCVVVCDLETSRMGAPYIYDISRLRVKAAEGEIDRSPTSTSEVKNERLCTSAPSYTFKVWKGTPLIRDKDLNLQKKS